MRMQQTFPEYLLHSHVVGHIAGGTKAKHTEGDCFGTHQDCGVKDITLQPIRLVLCERQIEYQTLLQHTSGNTLIFPPWSQSSVIT